MKSILMTLLCALVIASAGTCDAAPSNAVSFFYRNDDTGIYLKGFGGANLTRHLRWDHTQYDTSTGYAVGGALGYKLSLLSVEGEFSYRHNSVDQLVIDTSNIQASGDIEQWCGFGNVLLDFPMSCCFAPYVGVGAGYRHIKPGVNIDESSVISFASLVKSAKEWGVYQVIGGLNFVVSQPLNLQLEYRYVDGWSGINCSNHTVDLSARIQF